MEEWIRPDSIKICGVRFSVEWNVDMPDCGKVDFKELKISIASCSSDSMQLDTLLHEVFHVLWYFYSCRKREGEERVVSTMASGLNCVFSANPRLIDYINKVHGG